jgi:hypothetical protein
MLMFLFCLLILGIGLILSVRINPVEQPLRYIFSSILLALLISLGAIIIFFTSRKLTKYDNGQVLAVFIGILLLVWFSAIWFISLFSTM